MEGAVAPTCTVRRHPDAAAFLERAGPWLLRREAEHNLILGIAAALVQRSASAQPPVYLATIERGDEVAGCAFRTPPYKLGLTRMPAAAAPALADDVARVYAWLPAVMGPESAARAFAEAWAAARRARPSRGRPQGLYELDRVVPPARPAAGRLRVAGADDVDLVVDWIGRAVEEMGLADPRADVRAHERVERGEVYLWDDDGARSLAARVGRTPHGARIGYVYTPRGLRGRGYASTCVAALSQLCLDEGLRCCFLYTDLGNPTSNAIYARIGYRRIGEVVDYDFMAGA